MFLLSFFNKFPNICSRLKEDLAKEWQALQEKEKNEEINIAFVYWDGSSHRKDLKMKKGNTISQFLVRALDVIFNVLKYHHTTFFFSSVSKTMQFTIQLYFAVVEKRIQRNAGSCTGKFNVCQGRPDHTSFLHVSSFISHYHSKIHSC